MKIYRTRTVRLMAGHHDEELDAHINAAAEDGWLLHSVGGGVQTVVPGGGRAVDRLLVFERDDKPSVLVEDNTWGYGADAADEQPQ